MRRRPTILDPSISVALLLISVATVVACEQAPPEPVDATVAEELVASFATEIDHEIVTGTNCPVRGVRFIDRSTGNPETWLWTFPDGSTSDERFPTVAGEMVGVVRLVVTRGTEQSSYEDEIAAAVTC
jgi:hypothetical protein